ncbi:MAG: hypothetical protein EXQ48_02785 [Acidobacteria bacterium]|nr:hypothetical protein [Acidobacteriota bacterium]
MTVLLAVIALVLVVMLMFLRPAVVTIAPVLLALALSLTVWMVRQYALRLQNRIIRLEMQVRLARLGRVTDGDRLSVPQLVALRFASDSEILSLLDKTLADKLEPDQIKRAVTNWQGDHMRT